MIQFIRLLNFELSRFSKIFLGLISLVFVSQAGGMISYCYKHLNNLKTTSDSVKSTAPGMTPTEYKLDIIYGISNFFFYAPIAVGVTVITLYIFFIWYRDWFSKNTFIYRLLMLPMKRSYLFFAKALTILLYTLGLVAFQIINLHFLKFIFDSLIPEAERRTTGVIDLINTNVYLRMIIPSTLDAFVIYYFIGFCIVIALFTAILIERSYRLKGFFGAIVYCVILIASVIVTIIFSDGAMLFPSDIMVIVIILISLLATASFFLSNYLLNKKITV
ncbi:MAG: hypothetical protein K0S51_1052 [Bacillales bacterium]|jgi:hypothetical protein|nr:hypothetical protein [Bacillales bacterium]